MFCRNQKRIEQGSIGFLLAGVEGLGFLRRSMSTIPTADLLALDTDGIAGRLSKLRGYL